MKSLATTLLILSAVSSTAHSASIDGKWISETKVGDADGGTYTHTSTFTLKSDGGVLTGTVVQVSPRPWMRERTGRLIEIRDGKIGGDKFSFKVTYELKDGDKTAVYEGTVEGDQLKGNIKYRGIGITQPFEANERVEKHPLVRCVLLPISIGRCHSVTGGLVSLVEVTVSITVLINPLWADTLWLT